VTAPSSGPLRVADIAAMLGATIVGDPSVVVSGVAPLDRARPGELSFVASPRYLELFAATAASAVIVTPELAEAAGPCATRLVVATPHEAILAVIAHLHPRPVPPFAGVHPSAVVDPGAMVAPEACVEAFSVIGAGATVGAGAWIGPHCVIGAGSTVGPEARLLGHVTIYPGCHVGARSLLHAGVRVGSDGFGFVYREGAHQKIPHVGGCVIGADVEIGANCTIDRGSIDDTVIGDGTKLDNLVHIGHNVRVGQHCLMAAGCVVAGSARLEDLVTLAGQVAIGGHLTVGRGARIAAKSGVIKDVPPGETWSGFPARPHREEMRRAGAAARLPRIIAALERLIGGEVAS
jgi:UDP-3-O-[3-hydroxymyristoyl] glucosamine N-acyltransferase